MRGWILFQSVPYGDAGPPWFAVSPLMHAAGMWTAFAGLLNGQTVILYDKPTLDPAAVLATVVAELEPLGRVTLPEPRLTTMVLPTTRVS